jgi:hypothetical protein
LSSPFFHIFPTEVAEGSHFCLQDLVINQDHIASPDDLERSQATFVQYFFIFLLYFNGKLDGSMTMYDYVWLCMTMYDYVW